MISTEFAAAQARVAARQRQRETAAKARLESQAQVLTQGHVSRLPNAVVSAWTAGSAQWNLIRGREGTRTAFRVGQVDAELLDEELLQLLKGQVGEALKYFGTHLQTDWSAEIVLLLRAIIFKLSIWDHNASYGAALQNLRYRDARQSSLAQALPSIWQKSLYGLVSVVGKYGWTKWEDYLLDVESGYDEPSPRMRRLSRFTSFVSTTHSTAAFFSFLVFLYNGRYRTILDRMLRLRLAPNSSQVNREVSFEYLNRQLVWHAFTEFLLFLLPLVGISRWRRWISRSWRKAKSLFFRTGDGGEDTTIGGELAFLPERTCAICYQDQNPSSISEMEVAAVSQASGGVVGSAQTDTTNPYECIPCGCVYCFVCIAQRLEAEDGEGWVCLRCGETVTSCRPWNGDVMEDSRQNHGGGGKSVSFAAAAAADQEQPIKTLDPVPLEDEKAAEVKEDIRRSSESLNESAEWTKIAQSIEASHDDPVEDEAALSEQDEDDFEHSDIEVDDGEEQDADDDDDHLDDAASVDREAASETVESDYESSG